MGDLEWSRRLEALRGDLEEHARRRVGSRTEAADLAQEAIVRCMEVQPRPGEPLLRYVLAVLRNLLSRRWKHESRIVRLEEVTGETQADIRGPAVPNGPLVVPWAGFDAVEDQEVLRFLEGRIEALPPLLREVCEPHWLGEKTYREIADELGIDETTARVRCFKARRRLMNDPAVRAALGWAAGPRPEAAPDAQWREATGASDDGPARPSRPETS